MIPLSAFHLYLACTGSGSHVHVSTRPCSRTYRLSKVLQPTDAVDHITLRSPCSHAHFRRATPARVSSTRDWAVFIGSHMQQDIGISYLCLISVHFRKPPSKKLSISSLETQLSSASVPTRVFRPARRHMYRIIADIIGDIAKIEDWSGSVQISTCQVWICRRSKPK